MQMFDLDGNYAEYPIILEISCPEEVDEDFPYPSCVTINLFEDEEDAEAGGLVEIGIEVSASITLRA